MVLPGHDPVQFNMASTLAYDPVRSLWFFLVTTQSSSTWRLIFGYDPVRSLWFFLVTIQPSSAWLLIIGYYPVRSLWFFLAATQYSSTWLLLLLTTLYVPFANQISFRRESQASERIQNSPGPPSRESILNTTAYVLIKSEQSFWRHSTRGHVTETSLKFHYI